MNVLPITDCCDCSNHTNINYDSDKPNHHCTILHKNTSKEEYCFIPDNCPKLYKVREENIKI